MEIVTDPNRYGVDWQQLAELLDAAGLGQRDPQVLQRVYQHSQFCYWGYCDGRLVATAHAISDMTSVAYLADVALHPDVQGRGLGRLLMDRVKLDFYKKYHFRELTTGMVYADNASLERLQQNGYLRSPL
jgi:GNAT superfamily N-acetyltransferase